MLAAWLVPRAEEGRGLAAVIGELARRFEAPTFAPHVTLLAGEGVAAERLDGLLRRAAAATAPCDLTVTGTGHTDAFFRCVFAAVSEPPPIGALRRRLAAELGGSPSPVGPHLSLIYAQLPAGTRERLCAELAPALPARVPIDALEMVTPGGEPPDWRHVGAWRTLSRYPLQGGRGPGT